MFIFIIYILWDAKAWSMFIQLSSVVETLVIVCIQLYIQLNINS